MGVAWNRLVNWLQPKKPSEERQHLMQLAIDNLYATVVEAEESDVAWLQRTLSFEDEQARFRKHRLGHKVDDRVRMFDTRKERFATGMLPIVKARARKAGIQIKVTDLRPLPSAQPNPSTDLGWLFDYQLEGVLRGQRLTRGIFHMVTGAGKSELAVALAHSIQCRWLFLFHRMNLATQMAARMLKRTGEHCGFIGEGEFDTSKRVTCATFQTLYRSIEKKETRAFLHSVEGVIGDECHVTAAQTHSAVMAQTPNAYYRFGLSGTPLQRGDKRSPLTIGWIGPVIYRVAAQTLIERGVLAKPTIVMHPIAQISDKATWQGVYTDLVSRSKARNGLITHIAKTTKKPAMCFVKDLAHGKELERRFSMAGLTTEFIWGKKSTPVRDAAVKRLAHGDTDVIVCNVVFQEGVDIPELQSVIIAAGDVSAIAALQRTGRGTRAFDGQGRSTKDEFEVHDILDMGSKMMERRAKKRVAAYATEAYSIKVVDDPTGVGAKKLRFYINDAASGGADD
jgi:superfamily II DNA or RNA helicase